MKKNLLLASLLAFFAAGAINAQEVNFDFSDPTSLSQLQFAPLSLADLQTATYEKADGTTTARCYKSSNNHVLVIIGETISKDGVSFTLSNPDLYKDFPRFFFGLISKPYPETPEAGHFYCDLRWYQKEVLEITAPEGKKIDKIVMDAKSGSYPVRANGNTRVVTEGGKQTFSDDLTLNEWAADPGSEITRVTYRAEDSSPTQMAYSIAVTLSDINGAGIEGIGTSSSEAHAVYYDLTGNRYDSDALAPGVYVMRRGNTVKKVLVK